MTKHTTSLKEADWNRNPTFPECESCAYGLQKSNEMHFYCRGQRWVSHKTHPCEFYQSRDLICIYARPYDQDEGFSSGEHMTNCHCILLPELRDPKSWNSDMKQVPWSMRCSCGIDPRCQDYLRCYTPKIFVEMKNGTFMDQMHVFRVFMSTVFGEEYDGRRWDE